MKTSSLPRSSDRSVLDFYWQKFKRKFPNEDLCLKRLGKVIVIGKKCRFCGNTISHKASGARLIRCQFCLKKQWFTAGTFFHRIRRARAWLAAIFLLENGVAFNAFQFHRLLGIAYSSALFILKKLSVVIQSAMQEANSEQVSSALFLPLFTKRSRETPAKKSPASEQEAVETSSEVGLSISGDVNAQEEPDETIGSHFSEPIEKAIFECLSSKPTPYDVVCERVQAPVGQVSAALTMMELSGFINRLPGDQYVRCSPGSTINSNQGALQSSQKTLVDKIVAFTLSTFRGISRKYLQNYVSLYWCNADKKRWKKGALFELCLCFGAVTEEEILAYVTPPVVQVALAEC